MEEDRSVCDLFGALRHRSLARDSDSFQRLSLSLSLPPLEESGGGFFALDGFAFPPLDAIPGVGYGWSRGGGGERGEEGESSGGGKEGRAGGAANASGSGGGSGGSGGSGSGGGGSGGGGSADGADSWGANSVPAPASLTTRALAHHSARASFARASPAAREASKPSSSSPSGRKGGAAASPNSAAAAAKAAAEEAEEEAAGPVFALAAAGWDRALGTNLAPPPLLTQEGTAAFEVG
jgi:hypothetical protein